ncbi:cytochrome P450 71B5 isoform X2 [Capsella rubella]|uniref:cytochrome P450 71B5 isoform X2 n=1 Tax=Capsella rubella TaxID=81985 RepID=UPI000CD4E9A0|nr:cytochrome P450 71B5 isoform X2 [Capsella rubella]
MYLRFGVVPVIIVSSKEGAQEVLKTHDLQTCSRPKTVGTGLFTYDFKDIGFAPFGESWREMRKLAMHELFSSKKLKSFRYIREGESALLVKKVTNYVHEKPNYQVNLRKLIFTFSASIICRLSFGDNFCDFVDMDTVEELVLESEKNLGSLAFADFLPAGGIIDWISGCVFGWSEQKITEEDLDKVEYLKMVIEEAFRLHPPAPLLLPRLTMSDIKIQGYNIPKNTMIQINTYTIGRDPKTWTKPDEFIPERFVDNPIEYKGQHFELLPFGAGRRICPGMATGITIVELGLLSLLYFFDWSYPKGMTAKDIDIEEDGALVIAKKVSLELVPSLHRW